MKLSRIMSITAVSAGLWACTGHSAEQVKSSDSVAVDSNFEWQIDRFADVKVLRYQVPGFEELTLNQKLLIYYLNQAALSGRDIIWDQNYHNNLRIRRTLEAIYNNYKGERTGKNWEAFVEFLKRVWFSNGIHHHYATDKFIPTFDAEYFKSLVLAVDAKTLPLDDKQTPEQLIAALTPILFDATVDAKRVNLDPHADKLTSSACNFYRGVTEKEAEEYYNAQKDPKDLQPVSYGLNSRLVKENGKIVEQKYKVGGLYSAALEKIVFWLEKAATVAENDVQQQTINKLISYYKSGDLKEFDEFNILWLKDTASHIDFVNGFTEVYGDPIGIKATWESIVNFKNVEATHRTELLSKNAQWFEDNAPVDARFKKKEVKGVTAKVITVATLGGECYPATPIGINLPNSAWIRKEHGSKSVTIENITYAYDQSSQNSGAIEEFAFDKAEVERYHNFGFAAGNLHTDLHECLGHGSGQHLPGKKDEDLKSYHSTIEEARADLFALYYMMDPKMIELGLLPSVEAAKSEYDSYIRGGLMTQLKRIEFGKNLEESHMRNRQLIAKWVLDKGAAEKVITLEKRDGKSFYVIHDYEKLRVLFGKLLAEIQRVKSEGDYNGAKQLVETYGVKVDTAIHREVLERFERLNLASYGGFINPVYELIEKDGKPVDVKITYPKDYTQQMLFYSSKYSFLPNNN